MIKKLCNTTKIYTEFMKLNSNIKTQNFSAISKIDITYYLLCYIPLALV